MIFENRLEPCWPAEEVKTAACTAREKKIHAFAKANGWTTEIHDPGLSMIFKKNYGLMALPLFEIALVFVRFDHVARIIVNANHSIM